MKKRRTTKILLLILLLLISVAGGLLLGKPYIVDIQRQDAEAAIFSMIESGQTVFEVDYLPEMEGEQFAEMEDLGDMYPQEDAVQPQIQEKKSVTGYGLIEIPSIGLQMPVVEGADSYSLRAAAGWWPQSAEMGTAGNCAIFGHRMVTYGRHFNRLDEVKRDDEILLYNMNGDSFKYVVTGTEIIEPSTLIDTLYEHNDGFQLTLVTCTPTGVGSHRLLVYAELKTPAKMEE